MSFTCRLLSLINVTVFVFLFIFNTVVKIGVILKLMRHEDAFFGDTIGKHTHVFFLVVAFYMLCVDVCPFVYIHIVL